MQLAIVTMKKNAIHHAEGLCPQISDVQWIRKSVPIHVFTVFTLETSPVKVSLYANCKTAASIRPCRYHKVSNQCKKQYWEIRSHYKYKETGTSINRQVASTLFLQVLTGSQSLHAFLCNIHSPEPKTWMWKILHAFKAEMGKPQEVYTFFFKKETGGQGEMFLRIQPFCYLKVGTSPLL